MGDEERMTGDEMLEWEALDQIIRSQAWRYVRNILGERRKQCVEKAHQALKQHKDREAGEWLAKSGEPEKALKMIKDRLKELSEKRGGS